MFQETGGKPSIYTKLSCYLPWIAEQYDMDFTEIVEDDNQECTTGNGDINDYNVETCRCTCPGEDECIFPFYWNGKRFDQCTFLEEQEFLFPVFRCPTRNITRKINGTNSFVYADIIKQVFRSNPGGIRSNLRNFTARRVWLVRRRRSRSTRFYIRAGSRQRVSSTSKIYRFFSV